MACIPGYVDERSGTDHAVLVAQHEVRHVAHDAHRTEAFLRAR
jgi:hypothetical protein